MSMGESYSPARDFDDGFRAASTVAFIYAGRPQREVVCALALTAIAEDSGGFAVYNDAELVDAIGTAYDLGPEPRL